MKKLLLSLIVITVSVFLFAQTPNQFKYQAVLRNADGTIMAEENVTIVISILKSDLSTSVFDETHTTTTTIQGLINLNIGSIEDLSTLNWNVDDYYIEISVNGTIIGTSQLLSVPYALHAKTAESITGTITETDPFYTASQAANITATDITNLENLSGTNTGDQTLSSVLTQNNSANAQIKNVTDPTDKQDAATKAYIDNLLIQIGDLAKLLSAGFTVQQLLDGGHLVSDLVSAGAPVSDLVSAGVPVSDLLAAGVSVSDLLSAGVSVSDLFDTGIGVGTLEQNGVTQQTLTDAGLIGIISDVDGNSYKWIKIDDKVWMAENLKTTRYDNGDVIPDGTGAGDISGETDPEYWFAYEEDLDIVSIYGRLYTWYTVTDSRNVCPDGWHVPTDAEWTTLTDYLGSESVAGGKLKETGTTHWNTPNTGATNEAGFTALPGGTRGTFGTFTDLSICALFWSATEYDGSKAWCRNLLSNYSDVSRFGYGKNFGFSVRCLKD